MAKNTQENVNKISVAEAYGKYFLPSITSYQQSLEVIKKDFDDKKTELYKKEPRKHKSLAIGLEALGCGIGGTGLMFALSRALEFTVSQAAVVYGGWAAMMVVPFVLIEGGVHIARRIKYKKLCKKIDDKLKECVKKIDLEKQEINNLDNLVKKISTDNDNDFTKFVSNNFTELKSNVLNMNKIFLSLLGSYVEANNEINGLYKRAVEAVNTKNFNTNEYCERITDLLKTVKTLKYTKPESTTETFDPENSMNTLKELMLIKLKKVSPFIEVLNTSYKKIAENKEAEEKLNREKLSKEAAKETKRAEKEEREFYSSFGVDTEENAE